MSKFMKSLAVFLAAIPYGSADGEGSQTDTVTDDKNVDDFSPVDLRPMQFDGRNLFAQHRSHSSHASHRSSSGGGSPPPRPATPSPSSRPVDPGRPAAVSPAPIAPTPPQLSRDEKLTLQVMRVQLALMNLGLYAGAVDGVLGDETKSALKRFQIVKGLKQDGLMSDETLLALGVPPVQ